MPAPPVCRMCIPLAQGKSTNVGQNQKRLLQDHFSRPSGQTRTSPASRLQDLQVLESGGISHLRDLLSQVFL
ncbi:hypothetical protein K443DRAFT_680137 [Laccaria amethystina LaAM-08-1]|uniref:Uncharacterized protein n=1 Tax=Laccaria amethystina LaAM-08-1 TaxID=1095629 RepID=A0A0C9XTG0_9AGAR|nr:hypothetical protein K443DRAFT_680137 [Laccaria amethystina LaAM-08-1]